MCDNATTHGRSDVGVAYITAQRFKQQRCVLAIGDLGIGIPEHMRKAFPHLVDDEDAIREATKEGVTATGDPHSGIGYQWVIDGLKETKAPRDEKEALLAHVVPTTSTMAPGHIARER